MVFSNSVFLFLFLPISILVYYFPPVYNRNITLRNLWLLVVSLFFYAWGEPVYILLMILSIAVNHILGIAASKFSLSKKGKWIVFCACIYNLGQLFIFKYLTWIAEMVCGSAIKSTFLGQIVLPIGISFYTFQSLSYVIDVYRGTDRAQTNILNTGLYIAFFPQLIAGPIVRYNSISKQLQEREHNFKKFSDGVWRFVIGLSKKAILANQLSIISDIAFNKPSVELSAVLAWSGALCFMLQLYFDFSGYSDMAIGLGKIFGFDFMENFNYPYVSTSISEYWRRWHISLGGWFRDYLHYPLNMALTVRLRKKVTDKVQRKKASKYITIFVLFTVWLATGIWHGANFTFWVWGMIQFLCIVWEKFHEQKNTSQMYLLSRWFFTLLVVLFSDIIFKASNLQHAFSYYGSMFCLNGNQLIDELGIYLIRQYKIFILAGIVFSFPVVEFISKKTASIDNVFLSRAFSTIQLILLVFLLIADILYAVAGGYNPFLYFNF